MELNNKDLVRYNGAWLYPIDGGWEGNLKGFHYDAETLDELKAKIDQAVKSCDVENTLRLYSADRKYYSVLGEGGEEGPQWAVQFHLSALEDEYDDNMEQDSVKEVILNALDFDSAVKHAQQYIHVQARENKEWEDVEILSIEMR